MLKKNADFSEPGRKLDKLGSKLERGSLQLETSHPTCQAGQLRKPG